MSSRSHVCRVSDRMVPVEKTRQRDEDDGRSSREAFPYSSCLFSNGEPWPRSIFPKSQFPLPRQVLPEQPLSGNMGWRKSGYGVLGPRIDDYTSGAKAYDRDLHVQVGLAERIPRRGSSFLLPDGVMLERSRTWFAEHSTGRTMFGSWRLISTRSPPVATKAGIVYGSCNEDTQLSERPAIQALKLFLGQLPCVAVDPR